MQKETKNAWLKGWLIIVSVIVAVTGFCAIAGRDSFMTLVMNKLHLDTSSSDPLQSPLFWTLIATMLGVAIWAGLCASILLSLFRRKTRKGSGMNPPGKSVALLVVFVILCMPSKSEACIGFATNSVTVKVVSTTVTKHGVQVSPESLTANERLALKSAVDQAVISAEENINGFYWFNLDGTQVYGKQYGTELTLVAGVVVVVVLAVVVIGAIYIYCKVRNFLQRLQPQIKKKQDDQEDGTNAPTASLTFPRWGTDGVTEVAASFTNGMYITSLEALRNAEPATVVLHYTLTPSTVTGSTVPLVAYRPQNVMEEPDFRLRHGLGADEGMESFSVNRTPVESPEQVTLNRETSTVTCNLGNSGEKITTEVWWSSNLKDWRMVPMSRLTLPRPTATEAVHVVFEDQLTDPFLQSKFYQVRIVAP